MWLLTLIKMYAEQIRAILGTSGVSPGDIQAMGFARIDSEGFIIDPVTNLPLMSTKIKVDTYAELLTFNATAFEGLAVYVIEYDAFFIGKNGKWRVANGGYVAEAKNNLTLKPVAANSGLTWTASDNAGKIRLTASGAHGLTATSLNFHLILKTAPSLWPAAGTGFKITASEDVGHTVDTDQDWVTSMGTNPVFYTINEDIPIYSWVLDALREFSRVEIKTTIQQIIDAGATNKYIRFKLDGVEFSRQNMANASNLTTSMQLGFKNMGATNSQQSLYALATSGYAGASGTGTGEIVSTTSETGTGAAVVSIWINFQSAVNKGMWITGFNAQIFDADDTSVVTPPEVLPNWNPGNYIGMGGTNPAGLWDNTSTATPGILQRLAADVGGKWKGAMVRVSWPQLEGDTLGDYTPMHTLIDGYLSDISAFSGKRLIVFIQMKTAGGERSVPLYMRTSATYADPDGNGNGEYNYSQSFSQGGGGGYVPSMHVDTVQARFDALFAEFASRYDDNPYLEMICFTEANIQRPFGMASPWIRRDAWYDNMTESFITMRTAMPMINIVQWTSAARADMSTYNPVGPTWTGFIPDLIAAGIGVAMTDTCENDQGLTGFMPPEAHPSNLYFCQQAAGQTPVLCHMSRPTIEGSVANENQGCNCPDDGSGAGATKTGCSPQNTTSPYWPGPQRTRQAAFDWAIDNAGATHVVWVHNTGSEAPGMLPQYNATTQACKRATMPPVYARATDAYNGSYAGQAYNKVTDVWIQASPDSVTVQTRPTSAT